MVQPVGDVLGGDAAGRAVLHQADVVDVGHLGAADALVDPAHDVAEDALGVVVDLGRDLVGDQFGAGASGMRQQVVERGAAAARAISSWRAATSTRW